MTETTTSPRPLPDSLTAQLKHIAQLTLEEKVHLLTGETAFTLPGNRTIGLAPLAFSDGPTGVRGLKFAGGEPVALFPNATIIAGCWDDAIAEEVGGMLAEEAQRQDIHVVLGPTINLHRTPLGGRLFEAYSEDPYLTGRTAVGYVRAMQAQDVAACLKHLVANESETLRNFMDSRLSEKTLRELYLLPFSMAAQDAGVWSMMAAYNDINGTTATENAHVQDEIVKQEWGWDGLIMSDWFATKRTVESANGGMDLVMPGPEGPWGDRLVAAVRRGDVSEDTIDEHLARLLLLAERTGALGAPATEHSGFPAPDSPERRAQLRRIASRGMVLLKNVDGILPLARDARPALIGRHAVQTQGMGGGSAQVNPPHLTSLAEAFTTRLRDGVGVVDGVDVRTRPVPAKTSFVIDPITGEAGMRVTHFSATGTELATRHEAGTTITVGWDDDFSEDPAAVEFTVRLRNQSGPVRLGGIGAGNWTLSTATDVSIRHELPITGYDPADAMLRPPSFIETLELPADAVVTLRLEIAGVDWAEKFAAQSQLGIAEESHLLATGSFGSVSLVAEQRTRTDDDALAAAETAAHAAGTAVVVVGLTEEDETEAVDKSSLRLPGRQDELVSRVASAAERTVVVINAATPVLMPWLDEVDAVLIAGLPGQEAGDAIADVLFGDAEPTGRLVTSYPREDGASPAWTVAPDVELAVRYTEGTAIGYRGFQAGLAPEPLFWFGEGLGYGTWDYTDARLQGQDPLTVAVTLRNSSDRTSRETVQLYFQPALADEPVRLAGYTGIDVAPGATVTVDVECDNRLLQRWNEDTNRWEPLGSGELLVARGLGDVKAQLAVD